MDQQSTSELLLDFAASFGAFQDRVRRQREEAVRREAERRLLTVERHSQILRAMTTFRNALGRVCRLELGTEEYLIDLEVRDREGWPMLDLAFLYANRPENRDIALIVSASDRRDLGAITVQLRSGTLVGVISCANPRDVRRVDHLAQKGIRAFLDEVEKHFQESAGRNSTGLENDANLLNRSVSALSNEGMFVTDWRTRENVAERVNAEPIGAYCFD